MRSTGVAVLALAAAVGAAACSTLRVKTSHDGKANLAQYATFEVLPSNEIKRADVRDFLAATISAQLAGRGLKPVADGADLWVMYHVRLEGGKTDPATLGYSWDDGWDVYYGSMVPFGSANAKRELAPGMLIVDLVDAKEKRLVWQGTAKDTLDPQASTDEISARVTSALKKMISDYPRKK